VTFLMRSKFALDVFGRDGLETGRADRVDRFVGICSMSEWTEGIHLSGALLPSPPLRGHRMVVFGATMMSTLRSRLLGRLFIIARWR